MNKNTALCIGFIVLALVVLVNKWLSYEDFSFLDVLAILLDLLVALFYAADVAKTL